MVFKFEIGRKFESSDFGKSGFFRSGEMSASLNFDGYVAWVKDKFARCEMRMEKMSEMACPHTFKFCCIQAVLFN